MAGTKEGRYAHSVNKLLSHEIYHESSSNPYRGGTPDRYYEAPRGKHLRVEFKWYDKFPQKVDLNSGAKPKLSPLQRKWLNRAYQNGINVAVIIGSPDGGIVLTKGEWNSQFTPTNLLGKEEVASAIVNLLWRHS